MGICNCNPDGTAKTFISNEVIMPLTENRSSASKQQTIESKCLHISAPHTPKTSEVKVIQRKTTKKLIKVIGVNRKSSVTQILSQITRNIANKSISSTSLSQHYKKINSKKSKHTKKTRRNRMKTFNCYARKYTVYMTRPNSKKKQENIGLDTTNTNSNRVKEISLSKPFIETINRDNKIIDLNSTLLRSRSFLKKDLSYQLSLKSQTNDENEESNNTIKSNNKLNYCLSSREITMEDEVITKTALINNTLFYGLTDKHIKLITDCFNLYELEHDVCIFKEGETAIDFFLIISGQIKLTTKTDSKIISSGDSFGEISFVNKYKLTRTYSAYTLSKVQIFSFSLDEFKNVLRNKGEDYKELFFGSTSIKDEFKNDFYNFYLFQYLPLHIKDKLFSIAKVIIFNENNSLLLSSTYTSKTISGFVQQKKPILNHPKHIIFPIGESSCLIEKFHQNEPTKKIQKGNAAGLISTLFKTKMIQEYEIYSFNNDCICLILSEEMLRECIGVDYVREILFHFFLNKIKLSSELIPFLISKTKISEDNQIPIYRNLFQEFYLGEYKSNEKIFSRTLNEHKYILALNEDLFNQCNQKSVISKGNLFGESIINFHEL